MFNNNNIKIAGQAVLYETWYNKGVQYINDLLNENGMFYTEQEFNDCFKIKTNFIQYNGLILAIKNYAGQLNILNISKQKESYPIIPHYLLIYLKSRKGSKDFYHILNKNTEKPTSQIKWERLYDIESNTWKEIYMSPFTNKYSTSIQWFQYRINHRILPTKKYLFNINAIESPKCLFCHQEENITHMLWSCPETQTLLIQFKNWINTKGIKVSYIEELFVFNIGKNYSKVQLLLFMEIKYYIFTSKRLNSKLSITALKHRLIHTYRALKCSAENSDKIDSFNRNWRPYKELLDQ